MPILTANGFGAAGIFTAAVNASWKEKMSFELENIIRFIPSK